MPHDYQVDAGFTPEPTNVRRSLLTKLSAQPFFLDHQLGIGIRF